MNFLRHVRLFGLAPLALGALSTVACGGAASAPRATTSAKTDSAPSDYTVLKADSSKTLKSGAKLDVPAGWWVKDLPNGVAFQDPDRELTISLLEIDADATDTAEKLALAVLGRTPPPKIMRNVHEKDQEGWDEVSETVWETPPSEERLFALNVRRKDKKSWATLLEGKTTAFSRRGSQVQQIILGLEVPGVADEDLSAKAALPLEGERLAKFVTFVDGAREKAHVPGAAVAIVQNGKVVLAKGFGVRERGKKDPVTGRTRFMIGSVTKSLTTLLAGSLVDEGKVSWNARVKELLPTFETGDPAMTEKLTLENTFCACTGMPRRDLDLLFEYASRKPEDTFTAFRGLKPTTAMGETFQYSNQMTALGGFLAARVAEPNKPLAVAYASAMKARVFGPMGMNDTTASFAEGIKGTVATPHGDTLVAPPEEPMILPMSTERFVEPVAPAGAVFSTVEDMARYALVELAKGKTPEGKQVFRDATVLERRKPRIRMGAHGGYGLGLASSEIHGLNVVTHDGGTFGFVSRFSYFPDKDLGLVVLTNTTSAGATFLDAVTQRLLEVAFESKEHAAEELDRAIEQDRQEWQKHHDELAAVPVPNDVVSRVTGTWKNETLGTFTFAQSKGSFRLDVGEWSSRLGYQKAEDGTSRLFFLDPPVAGLPIVVEDGAVVLALGQESYRFTKK
jgi:CubicO group peptidase (beta-lactamase class C family)